MFVVAPSGPIEEKRWKGSYDKRTVNVKGIRFSEVNLVDVTGFRPPTKKKNLENCTIWRLPRIYSRTSKKDT